jgi:hypothetical protein
LGEFISLKNRHPLLKVGQKAAQLVTLLIRNDCEKKMFFCRQIPR